MDTISGILSAGIAALASAFVIYWRFAEKKYSKLDSDFKAFVNKSHEDSKQTTERVTRVLSANNIVLSDLRSVINGQRSGNTDKYGAIQSPGDDPPAEGKSSGRRGR